MKRIIIGFSVIAVAAAVVVGATMAFFNDTETSTGNIFTAGSIDITVDQFSTYNGENSSNLFPPRDLEGETFFDLRDVKPGDFGNTNISVHLEDNPAWACILIHNGDDQESDLTDAEGEAGDATTPEGELGDQIDTVVWRDDGDGELEPGDGEIPIELVALSLSSVEPIIVPIADFTTGGALLPNDTHWMNMEWCIGTQTVNPATGAITCDGASADDTSQTDRFSADLTIYAEQERNNPDFKCSDVELE